MSRCGARDLKPLEFSGTIPGHDAHGLDADRERVEQARRRAPRADMRVGLMESLPWPDDSFDVVTGFNAFQYAVDVDLALAEARRVVRPGGRIAICRWAPAEHNELFALLAALCGRGIVRAVSDPIDAAVRRAGLDTHAIGEVPIEIVMRDDAALGDAVTAAGTPPATAASLAPAAAPFRRADGSYRFTNRFCYRVLRT